MHAQLNFKLKEWIIKNRNNSCYFLAQRLHQRLEVPAGFSLAPLALALAPAVEVDQPLPLQLAPALLTRFPWDLVSHTLHFN